MFATHYSPFATHHSLIATLAFADLPHDLNKIRLAGASPSQFIPSLVPRPTPRFKSASTLTKPAEAG
jgi:hypothetical protein